MQSFVFRVITVVVMMGSLISCAKSSGNTSGVIEGSDSNVVSTTSGEVMPTPEQFKAILNEAYSKFKGVSEGKNADYIKYLSKVPSNLFGLAIVTAQGEVYTVGDSDYAFAIESVAKPFALALALQEHGSEAIFNKIGVEPTGFPFNSAIAMELLKTSTNKNPVGNGLVNAGAMATVSLIKADNADQKFDKILNYLSDFAGEPLTLNKEVYESEASDNHGNKGIAERLFNYGFLYDDPMETVDVYTKECSINVTAKQLAMMGATLANDGVNPITKKRLIDSKYVPQLLAVMMMAGFYDEAGWWAFNAGIPAKTGVGGGIVAVVPGKYSVVGFSPPLDSAGNSVRSARAISFIVNSLKDNLFKHR